MLKNISPEIIITKITVLNILYPFSLKEFKWEPQQSLISNTHPHPCCQECRIEGKETLKSTRDVWKQRGVELFQRKWMGPRAARRVFNLIEDIHIPKTNHVSLRQGRSSTEARKVEEMKTGSTSQVLLRAGGGGRPAVGWWGWRGYSPQSDWQSFLLMGTATSDDWSLISLLIQIIKPTPLFWFHAYQTGFW